MTAILSLEDVRVSFKTLEGTVQAVRGVSLDVEAGELLAVVGESGSGKSVTFLGVMGLLPGSATVTGSARLGELDLISAPDKARRRARGKKIAMIFQDPLSALNPVHRVGEQIVEMIQSHQGVGHTEAMKRAVDLLDLVGIPQPAGRARQSPHQFSGGMRQRVMIAMAIANEPEVLIADEPTTALDVTVQAQILDVLQRIQRELKAAVVLITHDLGVVARVADRVQAMYAGRVVERGSVESLYDHPSHPYTQGLMRSLPTVGRDRLVPIPGSPPNMLTPPSGCAFRVRCPHATTACSESIPELRAVGDLMSACIRADELKGVAS